MNEQNTDVNTAFKNKLIDQMDHISNISITTKWDSSSCMRRREMRRLLESL